MKCHRQFLFLLLLSVAVLSLAQETSQAAGIVNGSFETGDFSGWISTDIPIIFDRQTVQPARTPTRFDGFLGRNFVLPSDGRFAVSNGFDGGGPGRISLAQDIGRILPGDLLSFDYRAGWDLVTFTSPNALDRLFEVFIERAGGSRPAISDLILTAPNLTTTAGGRNSDTGPLTATVDLTPLAGLDARVNFVWTVPDSFTGPANAQLDNVRITRIPEPTAAMLALLGFSLARLRRRR